MSDIKKFDTFGIYSKKAVKISVCKYKNHNIFLRISFLNFRNCCQLGLPAEIEGQTGKIMKHTRADVNYAILTKQVIQQHEKKPASNLKCMQKVGFEQTFTKFSEIFIPKEQFLYRKKTIVETT